MADPLKMSASELGEAFENNLIDPVEALEAFIDVIQKSKLSDRIYVEVTKARAMGEAEDARKRQKFNSCLLYTSPSPRDRQKSRMPSSA